MISVCRTAVHVCSWFAKHARAIATSIVVIGTAGVCPLPCVGQTTPWNTNGSGIWYSPTGVNVGIGTPSPAALLEIQKPTVGLLKVGDGTNFMYWWGSGFNDINVYGAALRLYSASNGIQFRTGGADPAMTILNAGNVGIGTTNPTYKLSVNGTIRTKEVIVDTGWSDYVFKPDYRLKPLTEVAAYIAQNHHLPDIPSDAEVKENGVSLGEMQSKLLAKIEELTLHVIQEHERNDRLEQQNREILEKLARVLAR